MLLPPLPSAAGALQAGADTPARAAQEAGGSRKDSKPGYGHDADPVLKKLRDSQLHSAKRLCDALDAEILRVDKMAR